MKLGKVKIRYESGAVDVVRVAYDTAERVVKGFKDGALKGEGMLVTLTVGESETFVVDTAKVVSMQLTKAWW